jgi:hypothetical protein
VLAVAIREHTRRGKEAAGQRRTETNEFPHEPLWVVAVARDEEVEIARRSRHSVHCERVRADDHEPDLCPPELDQ